MFIITQSFPDEKILFASNSKAEAESYFNLQLQHGKGWFELWEEGSDIPFRADGDRFYAPYDPDAWRHSRSSAETVEEKGSAPFLRNNDGHRLILTTWE